MNEEQRQAHSDKHVMHVHLSTVTTETFDPKPAVDLWMQTANHRLNQGERSRPTSSTTMLERKEDSEESSQKESDDDSL